MPKFRVLMASIDEAPSIDLLAEYIENLPGFNEKCTHYQIEEIAENGERIGVKREGYPNVVDIRAKENGY